MPREDWGHPRAERRHRARLDRIGLVPVGQPRMADLRGGGRDGRRAGTYSILVPIRRACAAAVPCRSSSQVPASAGTVRFGGPGVAIVRCSGRKTTSSAPRHSLNMAGGGAALGLRRLRPAETFWGWLTRGLTLVLAHAMLSAVPVYARSHAGGGRLCMVAREDLRTAR